MDRNDTLTSMDLKGLIDNPDSEHKIEIIEKISGQYNDGKLTPDQSAIVDDIFRLLMKQIEVEVRKSLSDNLISNSDVPHDIILSLAKDVEEVSVPVLEFSEVLTDEDLIDIINTTDKIENQIAVANRQNISENVSNSLINTKNEDVVNNLMQNENASVSDDGYNSILNSFSKSEKIVDSMITRGSLPNRIITQMTKKVSDSMQKKLEKKYEYSFSDITYFFKESGEVAAHRFLGMQTVDNDIIELVDKLEKEGMLEEALNPVRGSLTHLLDGLEQTGKLTPLSTLAIGHMTLFEISIARLTGIPFQNAVKLVHDEEGGLKALYDRAQLPPKLYDAVHFIVHIVNMMESDYNKGEGQKASENLYAFMKNISIESKGKRISNLSHFIAMIKHHIDRTQSEW